MRDAMSANTLRMRSHTRTSLARMAGVSLIELMISIVLGMMVVAALVTVFASTSAARTELERTSRQIENGRYAIELLSDDLRVAGFYGELNVKTVAPVVGALPNPCSLVATDWAGAIPLHIQAYDNGVGVPPCVPGTVKANTDVLVVRHANTCEAGVAGCAAAVAGNPYFQAAKCGTESPVTPYVIGLQGTAPFTLHLRNCTTLAGLRAYEVHIYFVSTDNGAGLAIPTLKRMDLTPAGFVETPLVEGIEELNIEYGIDKDADGSPDVYTADPTNFTYAGCTACSASENWSNVMTARINILARNLEVSPRYLDSKTYSLGRDAGGGQYTVAPADGFRRHAYSGMVRIVNAAERRDTP
jgi:type IV pilus assembly protein PilW